MSDAQVVAAQPRSQYVEFWNNVLVSKFVRWRHILVDGLTLHSAKVVSVAGGEARRQGRGLRVRIRRYGHSACAAGRTIRVGAGG